MSRLGGSCDHVVGSSWLLINCGGRYHEGIEEEEARLWKSLATRKPQYKVRRQVQVKVK